MGIQGKDNNKDKCNVCKYFRDNPAYTNCPECGGEFELAKALFAEFAVLARKVYYDNKWVYDPKLDGPIYSKFVIYIAYVTLNTPTIVVSADMTSDYNIPPHIVKYAFTEDKKNKIGSCKVMSVMCPHDGNVSGNAIDSWCKNYTRSSVDITVCPVEVFAMAFSKYTFDALLGALEPPAVPIVEPTVELTVADTQIRKSWVNAGGWTKLEYNNKYGYNIVNPNNENLYIMPNFKCKSKSVFGTFSQDTKHMVFSIRMIQKYAPNLIKIGLDKLFGPHVNNVYVPQCECDCVRSDHNTDFMCPAAVIRDELIKAAYKIRDDAFSK